MRGPSQASPPGFREHPGSFQGAPKGPLGPPRSPWVPPRGPEGAPGFPPGAPIGALGTHSVPWALGSLGPEALRAGGLGKHGTTTHGATLARGSMHDRVLAVFGEAGLG